MDEVLKLVVGMETKLYGPKHCGHCKQVQPVRTFIAQGTEFTKLEGTTFTKGFTGSQACDVCMRTIEEYHDTEAKE